jgi:hypothetical protein
VISRFLTRLAISLAVVLIALIAAITAIVYFAYALYLLLLDVVVPPAAAVLTGILVLLAVVVLAAATRAAMRPHRRRRDPSPSVEAVEDAADLGGEIARKIRGLLEAHASGGLVAALVAGFAVGMSPKLRAFLQAILKP